MTTVISHNWRFVFHSITNFLHLHIETHHLGVQSTPLLPLRDPAEEAEGASDVGFYCLLVLKLFEPGNPLRHAAGSTGGSIETECVRAKTLASGWRDGS